MTFAASPAWMDPTVRTAVAVLGISREITVCNRSTVEAASTIGSTDASGIDPCAPRPTSRIRNESDAAYDAPA